MARALRIAAAALLLTSCRCHEVATTERQVVERVVSVERTDSVYIDRWHDRWHEGDTVYITDSVMVERYRSIVRTDTVRDTQFVRQVIREGAKNGGGGFHLRWWQVLALAVILVFCILI